MFILFCSTSLEPLYITTAPPTQDYLTGGCDMNWKRYYYRVCRQVNAAAVCHDLLVNLIRQAVLEMKCMRRRLFSDSCVAALVSIFSNGSIYRSWNLTYFEQLTKKLNTVD